MAVSGILAVIYGLKEIAQAGGLAPLPVGLIAAGVVVGYAFVRRQLALADPMIDVRLFRVPAFNIALAINFVSIFVMVGYFLFVAQYLQLVEGLSPLVAGLWSLPSAAAFVIGSQLTPRIVQRVRPGHLIGGGLALGAVGLAMLTQVGPTGGLATIVAASVVISIGLAPVFGLTTELIVGSAPPERAGAATGISETGAELGGALGIAILGSVGVAIYRGQVAERLPSSVPAETEAIARDTLGSAIEVAGRLPGQLGEAVTEAAREAFVAGMQLTSAIAAVLAFGLAVVAWTKLRSHDGPAAEPQPEPPAAEPRRDRPRIGAEACAGEA
jgi:DHA2 family multidrug resistance protein-like MFS transporter